MNESCFYKFISLKKQKKNLLTNLLFKKNIILDLELKKEIIKFYI